MLYAMGADPLLIYRRALLRQINRNKIFWKRMSLGYASTGHVNFRGGNEVII